MDAQSPKRRLKGLDEMPLRRRTIRQRYFSFRSRVRTSVPLGWFWLGFKWVVLVAVLWFVGHRLGWIS